MVECPRVDPRECDFNPGSQCTEGTLDTNKGRFNKSCEDCEVVIRYWRNKILEVFHNPVCLIDCEVRSGPSCPFTRGEDCPMVMTPKKPVHECPLKIKCEKMGLIELTPEICECCTKLAEALRV